MYEKVEECPLCKGREFTNRIICKDHTVSGESFAIVSCNKCTLWITSPRPTKEEIGTYYESDNYISHSNKSNNPINLIYKLVRNYTMHQKTSMVKKIVETGKLLDYGCGTGDFLNACKKKGFEIKGIEPNKDARILATKQTGTAIHEDIDELAKSDKVDIISLWHVLEHLHNPTATLKRLKKQLKKGGHLIVAVPNRDSFDASYYKEHWAAYDVPRHLFHFNQLNISKLAKKLKLEQVQTIPQYFDAYYVSMLGEKYMNNSLNFIKGMLRGFQSNQRAKRNSNNYSSLIYVLRKK